MIENKTWKLISYETGTLLFGKKDYYLKFSAGSLLKVKLFSKESKMLNSIIYPNAKWEYITLIGMSFKWADDWISKFENQKEIYVKTPKNSNKRVAIDNEVYSWTDFMENTVDAFKMQVFENSDPYEIEPEWKKQTLCFDVYSPFFYTRYELLALYSKKDYILAFDGYNDKVKVLKTDGTLLSKIRFSDKEENYFFKWADRMIELYELRFDTWDITSTSSHRYSAIKGNFHIQIVRLGAMLFYKKHAIMLIYQKPFETNNCYSYYCNQADKAIQEILNSQTGKFDHVIGLT